MLLVEFMEEVPPLVAFPGLLQPGFAWLACVSVSHVVAKSTKTCHDKSAGSVGMECWSLHVQAACLRKQSVRGLYGTMTLLFTRIILVATAL